MEEYEQQVQRKKQSQTKWYQQNKERLNTKAKQYYADNKARLKKESLQFVACPLCKTCVKKSGLSHHKRTQKGAELKAMPPFGCAQGVEPFEESLARNSKIVSNFQKPNSF